MRVSDSWSKFLVKLLRFLRVVVVFESWLLRDVWVIGLFVFFGRCMLSMVFVVW